MVPNPESERRSFINILHMPGLECPQLKVIRIDGSIYFGAVNHIAEELDRLRKQNPEQCHILVIGSGINFIDVAGCEMLATEAHSLHLTGGKLYLCGLKNEVLEVLRRGGYLKQIGEENIFHSKTAAVKSIVSRLDPQRCRYCKARIFKECEQMPKEEESRGP
jgi:SulP family sulfate permease